MTCVATVKMSDVNGKIHHVPVSFWQHGRIKKNKMSTMSEIKKQVQTYAVKNNLPEGTLTLERISFKYYSQ